MATGRIVTFSWKMLACRRTLWSTGELSCCLLQLEGTGRELQTLVLPSRAKSLRRITRLEDFLNACCSSWTFCPAGQDESLQLSSCPFQLNTRLLLHLASPVEASRVVLRSRRSGWWHTTGASPHLYCAKFGHASCDCSDKNCADISEMPAAFDKLEPLPQEPSAAPMWACC